MDVEFITKGGKPYALVPAPDYYRLMQAQNSQMQADIAAFDAAKKALDQGRDEMLPLSLLERQMAGEPALKIWREYRGLTQQALADAACISRALVANIEAGRKQGSISTFKKLSAALQLDVDDLI